MQYRIIGVPVCNFGETFSALRLHKLPFPMRLSTPLRSIIGPMLHNTKLPCSLSTTSTSTSVAVSSAIFIMLYPYPPPPVPALTDVHPPYQYPPPLVAALTGALTPYPFPPPPSYGYPSYPYRPPLSYGYPSYLYLPHLAAGSMGAHSHPTYLYPPPLTYPYSPPQPTRSRGGDHSSGGKNTSQTTQAPTKSKKRN
jgi:hypothetical protein